MTQIKVDWKPASHLEYLSYSEYREFLEELKDTRFILWLGKDNLVFSVVPFATKIIHDEKQFNRERDNFECLGSSKKFSPIHFREVNVGINYCPKSFDYYAILDIAPPEEQQP